jgi:hypothetical protein
MEYGSLRGMLLRNYLGELDKMMGDGLVTLEKVCVITYRASGSTQQT